MFLFILLLAVPLAVFGQDIPEPPADWSDIIMNPGIWFASFGAVSVLTAFVSAFVNGWLKVEKKFGKQLVAWVVAIVLLVVTDLLNWGYAADFPLLLAAIHGLAAGLAANGVFDVPFLKGILDAISGWFNPKE